MQLHGTQKCKESKYLEISNSLGPFNFMNINSNSLKQKNSYAKGLETHAHEKDNAKE
jgi:hypothetical protein